MAAHVLAACRSVVQTVLHNAPFTPAHSTRPCVQGDWVQFTFKGTKQVKADRVDVCCGIEGLAQVTMYCYSVEVGKPANEASAVKVIAKRCRQEVEAGAAAATPALRTKKRKAAVAEETAASPPRLSPQRENVRQGAPHATAQRAQPNPTDRAASQSFAPARYGVKGVPFTEAHPSPGQMASGEPMQPNAEPEHASSSSSEESSSSDDSSSVSDDLSETESSGDDTESEPAERRHRRMQTRKSSGRKRSTC